jgi:enamidase
MISGELSSPLLEADSLLVEDGLIAEVGRNLSLSADIVIDCQGTTLSPGLFDTHCHVVLGDYTPRQNQSGFLESAHHGAVTTFISAGEVHLPGRPTDPVGAKALAVLANKSFSKFRPGGAKVLAGALILEKGLVESDFAEVAAQGVRLVGEVGLGSVKSPEEAAPMVSWAKKYGLTVMMHTGGTSIPGSSTVTAEQVMAVNPNVVSHLNGGPTAIAPAEIVKLVRETNYWLELVHCGNNLAANLALNEAKKSGALDRFILGNDAPSGTGVVSLGILRLITHAASLGGLDAAEAMCLATGNPAKAFKRPCGRIQKGLEADLALLDAPMGSYGEDALSAMKCGDIPGVSLVMVDGRVTVNVSRNTPPTKRKPIMS